MKQKFIISKSDENNKLIIKEMAELHKGMFSLVCEETYDNQTIESAIASDINALISVLRTRRMYPVEYCAGKIAVSVKELYASEDKEKEMLFDDLELMSTQMKEVAVVKDEADEVEEIDEIDKLLEDVEIEEIDVAAVPEKLDVVPPNTTVADENLVETPDEGV